MGRESCSTEPPEMDNHLRRAQRQRIAITNLVLEKTKSEANEESALARIAESLAKALEVARASIWLLSDDGYELQCVTLYETASGKHSSGMVLDVRDHRAYFETIKNESRLVTSTAQSDPRLKNMSASYLRPLGITAILDASIVVQETMIGVVCAEHVGGERIWQVDEESFVNVMAAFTAQQYAEQERTSALEALRQSQMTLDSIVQKIPDLVYRLDAQSRITFINDAVLSYGYKPAEMLGTSIFDYVHPEDREQVQNRINERRTGERRTASLEVRLLPKNSIERHFEIKSGDMNAPPVFLLDAEGLYQPGEVCDQNFIGTQGVARDITERKRNEEALRKSTALLSSAEQIAKVGGWIADLESGEIVWSDQVARIHGKEPGYSPTAEASSDFIAPEYREQVEGAFFSCYDSGVPFIVSFEIINVAGDRIWVRTRGEAVRNEEGKIIQINGALQDISEHKRAEMENEKLQAQLVQAQKMESIGRLAGGVAHDYNNMLQVISVNADLALLEENLDRNLVDQLREISSAAERSAAITRQLLTFARKQAVIPKVVDLNDIVEGMLKLLYRLIGEDIDLKWIPGEKVVPVKIDPTQLEQILANLCVNARDAIEDVGLITVETRSDSFKEAYCEDHPGFVPGNYVGLSVSDDGCGMDPETQSCIFDPFFTTKDLGKGTGLGLATVFGIVKQNDGFINIYSEPGQGTRFTIYLPAYEEEEAASRLSSAAEHPLPLGRETIMVVEDELAILKICETILERLGYTVLAAQTPREALRVAKEHHQDIDLLITDVVMPEMNGRDLSEKLQIRNTSLKLLFMSGYTSNFISHHGVLKEGIHFIQKPFTLQDLAAKVHEVLIEN